MFEVRSEKLFNDLDTVTVLTMQERAFLELRSD
jgi:hypothetical protein